MSRRPWVIDLLTMLLSLAPRLYLQLIWPALPARVPMHFNAAGRADHFTDRQWLHDLTWLPVVVFVALTLVPQVHDGETLFWRSPRQRQLRGVLVGALSLVILGIMYKSAHLG